MTTKLYIAAEARRIDIERGGEGRIKQPDYKEGDYVFFNEIKMAWISSEINCSITVYCEEEIWLPLTPEPEAEKEENMVELWQQLDKLKQAEIKIEQLEKELAELKEKAKWKRCYEETPTNQSDVFYQDEREDVIGHGHFRDEKWWLAIGDSKYLCLSKEQVLPLKWKYEEDL